MNVLGLDLDASRYAIEFLDSGHKNATGARLNKRLVALHPRKQTVEAEEWEGIPGTKWEIPAASVLAIFEKPKHAHKWREIWRKP